ncbi:unnamed protein product [Hymenolepis diminuta]|uniref:Uncharacterized protein n=1 Tax=Hymenolepis diminuta TaxID=6216 RepID=A0A564YH10_HYMDI|nr:unnamed protein product [Hymenolepis diminuta]
MEEVFCQDFSLFNARFNHLKLVINHDLDLEDFAGVVNFRCFKFKFGNITDEQFRCHFHPWTSDEALVVTKTPAVKNNREKSHCKAVGIGQRWVKMKNLRRDSTVIDFDSSLTCLINEMSVSMSQSAKFLAQPNPIEQKPLSPCPCCRNWNFF